MARIDCYNGPIFISANSKDIEVKIGPMFGRGRSRYATLTPKQGSELLIKLQEALQRYLPEDSPKQVAVTVSPGATVN